MDISFTIPEKGENVAQGFYRYQFQTVPNQQPGQQINGNLMFTYPTAVTTFETACTGKTPLTLAQIASTISSLS